MLKKAVISCILFGVAACCFAQDQGSSGGNYEVKGTIKGFGDGYFFGDLRPDKTRDTIFVKNDEFKFLGKTDKLQYFSFITDRPDIEKTIRRGKFVGYLNFKNTAGLEFFAAPGDHIRFDGVLDGYLKVYPSGTQINNDLGKLLQLTDPLDDKNATLLMKVIPKKDDPFKDEDTPENKRLNAEANRLSWQVDSINKQFISQNPTSVLSCYLLSKREVDPVMFSKLKPVAPNRYYDELKAKVARLEQSKKGKIIDNIVTSNTLDGKRFDVKTLQGKPTLIDFWGTWCVPCVAELPELKAYYEKNKDKFNLVSISSDKDKAVWEQFLKKNNYPWVQILNKSDQGDFVKKLGVQAFPTKIILDKNGVILDRYAGGGLERATKVLEKNF